jgi:hypothetical protein
MLLNSLICGAELLLLCITQSRKALEAREWKRTGGESEKRLKLSIHRVTKEPSVVNTVLLSIITGMMIGKWIVEPLIDIYRERKDLATFEMMWDKNDWQD